MTAQGYIVIVEPADPIRELLGRWLSEAGYGIMWPSQDHMHAVVKPQLVIADISNPRVAHATIGTLRAAYAAPILALVGTPSIA